MYRFDRLDQESWRPVAAANRQQETHVLSAMNSVAENVIRNGGDCDEAALIASFFHRAVLSGDVLYGNSLTLAKQVTTEGIQHAAQKISSFNYALGEPFVHDGDFTPVGIIARPPAARDAEGGSQIFRFNVERLDEYTFGGSVAIHAYIWGRDEYGRLKSAPKETDVNLFEVRRSSGFLSLLDISDYTDRLTVGMPDIRKSLELNQSYVTEGVWHSVDESVAALREFAGDQIVTPRSYAAD